tara:strand:- start:3222 stop:3470 length:249 start_codon:yes stop_codon:yes gene_type:complete
MLVIKMCEGDGCKLKISCERFTSKASQWQSWFTKPPLKDEYTCEMYLNDKKETEIVEKELWDHYSELPNPAWYDYKNKELKK